MDLPNTQVANETGMFSCKRDFQPQFVVKGALIMSFRTETAILL